MKFSTKAAEGSLLEKNRTVLIFTDGSDNHHYYYDLLLEIKTAALWS